MKSKGRDADEILKADGHLAWRGDRISEPDGLAVLQELVKDVEEVNVLDDPRELKRRRELVIASLYESPGRFLLAARALIHKEAEATGLLLRLAASTSKAAANRLEKALKRRHKQAVAEQQLRLVAENEGATLKSYVGWDGIPDGILMPPGWAVTERALAKTKRTETGAVERIELGLPMVMTRRYKDVDSGDHTVELAWPEGDGWHRECIDRDKALDTRALVRLAARGAPVSSVNGRLMVEWLQHQDQSPMMPLETSTVRMGWVGKSAHYYVLGQDTYGPVEDPHQREVRLVAPTSGGKQLAEAVSQRGTWEGWLLALELIKEDPAPWAVLYAAATAPLLKILDAPNFGVDLEGPSGSGKSTSLELAVSSYGEPRLGRGYRAWGGTVAGTEGSVGMMCDLPLALDEGQKVAPSQRQTAASLLHTIIDGSSRAKGALGRLGMGTVESWRTVLLSTSETGITDWADYDGARARVVELRGRPLGVGQADKAEGLRMQVRANYGHLYPRLIQLIANKDRGHRGQLREIYRQAIAELGRDEEVSHMARRAAQYVAAIEVAAHLLHEELGIPRPACDPMAWLWDRVKECMGGGDKARGAASAAWAWIWANKASFQQTAAKAPPGGWLGVWDDMRAIVGVRKPELEKALKDAGYQDYGALYREWIDRGWMEAGSGGRLTKRVLTPVGERPRLLALSIHAADDEGL